MRKLWLACIIASGISLAQNAELDSLSRLTYPEKHDTTRAKAFVDIGKYYLYIKSDTLIPLAQNSLDIVNESFESANSTEKKSLNRIKAQAYQLMGYAYRKNGNISIALNYYYDALKLREELKDLKGQVPIYRDIAFLHVQQDDYENALGFFNRGLSIIRESNDKAEEAYFLSDIGYCYSLMKDTASALSYFNETYNIDKEIGDTLGMAYVLINIGYMHLGAFGEDSALHYFNRSQELFKLIGDQGGLAYVQSNIGRMYRRTREYDRSAVSYRNAISIRKNQEDTRSVSIIMNDLSEVYFDWGKVDVAIAYADSAMQISSRLGFVEDMKNSAGLLAKYYKRKAERGHTFLYPKVVEYTELYYSLRDSVVNLENKKATISAQYKFEYEKQSIADSLEFARIQQISEVEHKHQLDQEKSRRFFLYGGIFVLAVVAIIIFRGYRRKQKDNEIITEQKNEVEKQKEVIQEKNQEILDSITYAQRIQQAILPPLSVMKKQLNEVFVLFKPKDIVAGDFYWIEKKNDSIIFAAADCTGHGVPGAMVSVVCHNALNRAVREFGLTNPAKILDLTRELVIGTFELGENDVKDGMDIALVSLAVSSNSLESRDAKSVAQNSCSILHYSGANNPLWIIRKDSQELNEIKADKQPIGKYSEATSFTNHEIEVRKGDMIYLFSDGFADQFGGEKGKKYKYKALKDLLITISSLPIDVQQEKLDIEFENWKGEMEQVDDVCVIGVRL